MREGFGGFEHALIVGNFGDGTLNVFDLKTGNSLGQLTDSLCGSPAQRFVAFSPLRLPSSVSCLPSPFSCLLSPFSCLPLPLGAFA